MPSHLYNNKYTTERNPLKWHRSVDVKKNGC